MCSSKLKLEQRSSSEVEGKMKSQVNRRPLLERCNSIIPVINANKSVDTILVKSITPNKPIILLNKSRSFKHMTPAAAATATAGSIAAATKEQVEHRKMRIAHYGRTTPKSNPNQHSSPPTPNTHRCTFITPNSDPIYVAYHDQEWGVPLHNDELLFELLVLTGSQVGSDWSSVLRKRQDFRDAFSNFDAETVSKHSEKKIISISTQYCIQLSFVRGVVDNSNTILQVQKEFGSLDNYLWGFVNYKTISREYRRCNKIPVKTSKSEAISKDMVRRGFRQVGPTVIHSFMQAAGLTNDHLITCPRHRYLSDTN